jgi:myosin-5
MRTYLLERSRLTFQPENERNYHIFYQLCAAVPAAEKKELGLENWDHFHYLKQGRTGTVKGMDDKDEFRITQKGMSSVGIGISTQWHIFKICAALLHIGNIKIENSNGNAQIDDADPSLVLATRLLGVDKDEFKKWLIKKQIITRSEKIVSDAKYEQALTSRDSIAKFIYSMLFDWIVKIVNLKLDTASNSENLRFIGVLDIYGFEHFAKNSFEQFCINFANEKLQQEFTRHVFKLEQEEYVAEQIAWSFIDFTDNQPCIQMIEGKMGIMDLLDEESRLPSGADSSLITKYYQRFAVAEFPFFAKPKFGQSEFVIKHYALDVSYQIEGFIEKNKDTVSDEQLATLNASSFDFLKEVIIIEPSAVEEVKPGRSNRKPTLGSIFKGSLIKLMETLRKTNPHYIRCIKPNQSKQPFEFEPQNVLGQLIACGVLETIKISRAGYPSKQTYAEFVNRYYFLLHSSQWRQEAKKLTDLIVKGSIKGTNKYELGKTKIFFRAGQLAYLEKLRNDKYLSYVYLIQKNALRSFYSRKYQQMRSSSLIIQKSWRLHRATKEEKIMLKNLRAEYVKKHGDIKNLNTNEVMEVDVVEYYIETPSETDDMDQLEEELLKAQEAQEALEQEARRVEALAQDKLEKEFQMQLELQKEKSRLGLEPQEVADLKKYLSAANHATSSVAKGTRKLKTSKELHAVIRQRDAQIVALEKKMETVEKQAQAEARRMIKEAPPKKDEATVEALKAELTSMRELTARLFTEKSLNKDVSDFSFVGATAKASRMSMIFIENTAAEVSKYATPIMQRATGATRKERREYSGAIEDSIPKEVFWIY